MFRKIEDFTKAWEYETEATVKMLNALTDASLDQKVSTEGRTLGYLAWHLVLSPGEMLGLTGIEINGPESDAPAPATVSAISEAFSRVATSVAESVPAKWNDETLVDSDEMYGETWQRGLTLFYLIVHQAHHRGQMTVLMRQAGLPVPGVYGPSKEEWAAMGAPAMP